MRAAFPLRHNLCFQNRSVGGVNVPGQGHFEQIIFRNPVHFANRVYMVKIAVYLTADNRQRVSFLYNINPVLTVRASNSLFICPLRRIASLRFFFIIALRQAVFRIFIFLIFSVFLLT